jgi:hypothetical protein
MPPRFVEDDGTDGGLVNANPITKFLLAVETSMIQRPNFNNLLGRNPGLVVSFTDQASSFGNHIVNIVSPSPQPQVIGTNAELAIASVQNEQSFRNGSEVNNPGQSVCPDGVAVRGAELAISGILKNGPAPKPTPVWFLALNYSLPKALKNAIIDYHSSICAFGLQARRAFLI